MKYLINHLILRELIENIKLIIKKGTEESELFFTLAEEGLFSESSQILDKIEENSTTD